MKMGDAEFEATVGKIEELVQSIGYPETDRIEIPPPPELRPDEDEETEKKSETLGEIIAVEANAGPDFAVIAQRNKAYFEIQSTYPLWEDIATVLNPEKATGFVPENIRDKVPEDHPARAELQLEDLDEDRRLQILGAFEFLRQLELDVRKELVYQLSKIFTRAEVKHVVNSPDETAAPHEFTVKYRIFPYEDTFGPRELNETVEKVRMAAQRGKMYLRYTFNIGVDIDRTTASDVEGPPDPTDENGTVDEIGNLDDL
jgi:hypothetical protein